MKVFQILKDFDLYDAGDTTDVDSILASLNINGEHNVTLDLSGCLIDYPSTSMLIDAIVRQMKLLKGAKTLKIIIDYKLPPYTLINYIFIGSSELGCNKEKQQSIEEIIAIIVNEASKNDITIQLIHKEESGNEVAVYDFKK